MLDCDVQALNSSSRSSSHHSPKQQRRRTGSLLTCLLKEVRRSLFQNAHMYAVVS
jgi:hypothetical protein